MEDEIGKLKAQNVSADPWVIHNKSSYNQDSGFDEE